MKCSNGSYGVYWRIAQVNFVHLWFFLFVALALITGLGDSPAELDFSREWVTGFEYFGVWIVLYTPRSLIMIGNILQVTEMKDFENKRKKLILTSLGLCALEMDAWQHQNLKSRISGRPQNILQVRPGIP